VENNLQQITRSVQEILRQLPPGTILVAAAKSRTPAEVQAAIDAGIRFFGENYIQEAEAIIPPLRDQASWHFIGHLQRNKVNKAVGLFDMIETVDSIRLADALEKACARERKNLPVLIEVNSGEEENKDGVLPGKVPELAAHIDRLPHLVLQGVMTMGPLMGDPEDSRPYFRTAHRLFDELAGTQLPGSDLKYLSMGMSNSYLVALEEGANIIRIGTRIFGPRS